MITATISSSRSGIFNVPRRIQRRVMRIRSRGFIVNTRLWSKRWREKNWETTNGGTFDRVSASSQPRDAVGKDLDAITIRLSPSVVLLQSGYQLSNPLISVHSIYVRLSSLVDRRGDNDLPVWESARRCIVNRPRGASHVVTIRRNPYPTSIYRDVGISRLNRRDESGIRPKCGPRRSELEETRRIWKAFLRLSIQCYNALSWFFNILSRRNRRATADTKTDSASSGPPNVRYEVFTQRSSLYDRENFREVLARRSSFARLTMYVTEQHAR